MKQVASWIRNNQIIAFFVITFAISHAIGISGVFLTRGGHPALRTAQFFIVRLLLFGPALAGMIVARVSSTGQPNHNSRTRWTAFWISWAMALVISALYIWRTTPDDPGLLRIMGLSALGAMFPAFVISGAFSGVSSIRTYLSTLVRPRGGLIWYLVALVTFPAIHVLGNVITRALGDGSWQTDTGSGTDTLVLVLITFVHVLFYTGGVNEECGWRGFALPRLQKSLCPLVACLIIWGFHVLWELPFDTVFSGSPWPAVSRLVWMPSWSILFVWVYNRTKGSILAPVLFHASMNAMNPLMKILPPTDAGTFLLVALAAFAVIYDRMWKKLSVDRLRAMAQIS
jgi:membrane protease YdiL (CAAX protease family)